MKRISDRKMKKMESKKRKITALINLLSDNEKETIVEVKSDAKEKNDKNVKINGNKNDVFSSNSPEISTLRQKLSQRIAMERPKIFLEDSGIKAKVCHIKSNDTAIYSPSECLTVRDIQQLILACLLPPPRLSHPPLWCKVIKPTKATKVTIFKLDYDDSHLQMENFQFKEIVQFNAVSDWIEQIMNVPLSNRQLQKLHLKANSTKSVAKVSSNGTSQYINGDEKERVSRTSLLLSPLQMAIEKYPLPSDDLKFRATKTNYSLVTDSSPLYAIDCEMCYTTADKLELAKVSLINEQCEPIYETLVKPKNRITNYLTKFSGVTKKMLDPVTVTIEDVQEELCRFLPDDAILCGQSLNCDLHALQLQHPYIIDTSVIYNMSGFRHVKSSLKALSSKFLNMEIQNEDSKGHDPCEDAIAAMKLVKLKLNMGLEFGDRVIQKVDPSSNDRESLMTLTNYTERCDVKLNVYYDNIDLNRDDKYSITIISDSKKSDKLIDAISQVIYTDKAIGIILNRQGLCYIKF